MKTVIIVLAALAFFCGAILSSFASEYPDGLEWSILKVTGSEELSASGAIHDKSAELQERSALMPDYSIGGGGTAAAGVIGTAVTFAVTAAICALICGRKKKTDLTGKA